MSSLTVKELLLIAIRSTSGWGPHDVAPYCACQDGLANEIGKSRAHVSVELRTLLKDKLIIEYLAHIEGCRNRRKAYALTDLGYLEREKIARYDSSIGLHPVKNKMVSRPTNYERISELESRVSRLEQILSVSSAD